MLIGKITPLPSNNLVLVGEGNQRKESRMNPAPIELNLYNENDEVVDTLRRSRIPSYLLDMAIDLQRAIGAGEEIKNADPLFDFVVEFFGNKITREELKRQTDLIECMAVFQSVIVRASELTREFARVNPPVPSPKKK